MLQEFKKFISKGNVMEMAVGLIMAVYFGAIIKSLVDHIIMPPIGLLLGGVDSGEVVEIYFSTAIRQPPRPELNRDTPPLREGKFIHH